MLEERTFRIAHESADRRVAKSWLRRRWIGMVTAGLVLVSCQGEQVTVKDSAGPQGPTRQWTFDEEGGGRLPKGAYVLSGTWTVRAEAGAPSSPNAFCQTGRAEFPAVILGDDLYTNLVFSAWFKPISGREDQAAGLIFRIQDRENYYILRANALEGNVNLYKYAGGQRRLIKEGLASVRSGQWQELKLEAQANRLRGYLNNQLVVQAEDDTFQAGRVGLWTKADSVTCFDNVAVQPGAA